MAIELGTRFPVRTCVDRLAGAGDHTIADEMAEERVQGVHHIELRTAERLVNLVALFCILSWRIFWLTMLNRAAPQAPAKLALTATEIAVLDEIAKRKGRASPRHATIETHLIAIARLGGYLARDSDGPPGNKILWRGISKLADIAYGATLRLPLPRALVGN